MGNKPKGFGPLNGANQELPVISCTKYDVLVDSLEYFGRQGSRENTSTYKVVRRGQFAYATNHIEKGSSGYQDLYDKALISPMYTIFETDGRVNDVFLFRLLKTELFRHIFEVNTSGTVDRRGSLRWGDFSKIKIPLPSVAEQAKIAEVFLCLEEEVSVVEHQAIALRQQKQALMQQLLTGQVRVNVTEELVPIESPARIH